MPAIPIRTSPTLDAVHARREAIAARSEEKESPYIRASAAHYECARALWLNFRWASGGEILSPRVLRLFSTGHREETRIVADLRLAGIEIFDQQQQIDIAGYIRGHIDGKASGVPEAEKTVHLLECKTANEKSFNAIKSKGVRLGKPDHWTQVQLYMHGTGLTRCLYYLINKNTDEEYVERLYPDPDVDKVVARLVTIAEAPRPPALFRPDALKPPCSWCRHKGLCHEGVPARVNCRTCLHSSPRPGGTWWCEHFKVDLSPADQAAGEQCPAHRYIPDLVDGEQTDVRGDAVVYRMRDGSEWIDGPGRAA